jgi:N-acetylneuraminic acid mutarotase
MPTARTGLTAAVVNGKIFACGGYQTVPSPAYLTTVEEYDPAADRWMTGASMPVARAGLASDTVGGRIYAIGGDNPYSTALTTVDVYDPVAGSWQSKTAMPSGLSSLAAAAVNSRIYALGAAGVMAYTPGSDL